MTIRRRRSECFLEEVKVGWQLDPRTLLELGQDFGRCFFYVLPDEVWAWAVGLNQPARLEPGKRRTQGKARVARATTKGARRSA